MAPAPTIPPAQRALFAQIVRQHRDLVCGVAYATIGNRAQSEEVAQEAFLTAWRKLPELRDPDKLPAWLCGIARHLALNARRKSLREVSTDDIDAADPHAATAFDDLATEQSKQVLRDALKGLPDNYREALVLYYRADKSVGDVAAALDVSVGAAKQLLSRGRKRLRARVDRALEASLAATKPTAAFTAAVLVAFDAAGVVHAEAPAIAGGSAGSASSATGSSLGKAAAVLGAAGAVGLAAVVYFAATSDAPKTTNAPRVAESAQAETTSGGWDRPSLPPRRAAQAEGVAADPSNDASGTSGTQANGSSVGLTGDEDSRGRLQRKIDLDFGQADVRMVIRLIATVTEVDFVVDEEVSAMVNMRMLATPSIDALDEALKQAGAVREEIPVIRIVSGEAGHGRLFEGKPVTASFDGATIHEIGKTLSEHSDVPVVVAKGARAEGITIAFADEPFGTALERVLRATDLGVETGFAFKVSLETPPEDEGP